MERQEMPIKMCRIKDSSDANFIATTMNNYLILKDKRSSFDIFGSKARFYIAKVNGMPCGICAMEMVNGNSFELKHIVVFRECRGKGIAKHMIEFMVNRIKEKINIHNHHNVYMTINKKNIAMQKCAESCGFEREGLLKNHFIQNSDVYVYAKGI